MVPHRAPMAKHFQAYRGPRSPKFKPPPSQFPPFLTPHQLLLWPHNLRSPPYGHFQLVKNSYSNHRHLVLYLLVIRISIVFGEYTVESAFLIDNCWSLLLFSQLLFNLEYLLDHYEYIEAESDESKLTLGTMHSYKSMSRSDLPTSVERSCQP